jgi:hypothetical protein
VLGLVGASKEAAVAATSTASSSKDYQCIAPLVRKNGLVGQMCRLSVEVECHLSPLPTSVQLDFSHFFANWPKVTVQSPDERLLLSILLTETRPSPAIEPFTEPSPKP